MMKNIGGNYFDKYNSKNPIIRILMKNFYDTFIGCLEKESFNTMVDIGCGEWHLTNIIQKRFIKNKRCIEITALEYEQETIKIGNTLYPSLWIQKWNILKLYGEYDLLIASEVLEHIEDFEWAISACKNIAPICIFSVPNEPWFRIANIVRLKYIFRLGNTPGHVNNWTRKKFELLLKKHFLSVKLQRTGIWNVVVCKEARR